MKHKKMNNPFISVIMPSYNAGAYLGVAIESILNQTYRNFELIIVDDASTDTSYAIAKSYKKRHPKKIRLLKLKKNQNCGGDRCANEGLLLAKGDYIARMDADDIAHPERLEKQVIYLEKHKNTFLVGTNAYVINSTGEVIGEKKEPRSHKAIYESYCIFHPLIHPSCMFRRIVNGKVFQYDIKYSANNDYNTFFRLLCQGETFVNLEEKLLYYRIHGQNDTLIHVKEKFLNTLKVRISMVRTYHYRPPLRAIVTSIAQAIILLTLPEKVLINLYLISKGIKRFSLPRIITTPALLFRNNK